MCWFWGYCLLFLPRSWSRQLDVWINLSLDRLELWLDTLVRWCGPMYILLGFTLISSIIYLYFTTILPSFCNVFSLKWAIHMLVAMWLAFNVLFNYYFCVVTDPGSPPQLLGKNADDQQGNSYSDRLVGTPGQLGWCRKCQNPKPPMTHHCHICDRCILKMDHHCPWMHNCVGFKNYPYFFNFLAYLWFGCIYSVAVCVKQAMTGGGGKGQEFAFAFTFTLSLAIGVAISVLLGWHVYIVATGQTTIEFYCNLQRKKDATRKGEVWENGFDLGWRRNFTSVFEVGGRFWFLLLLLPRTAPLRADGMSFAQREDGYDCSNIVFREDAASASRNIGLSRERTPGANFV